jgi:hypothetical protein
MTDETIYFDAGLAALSGYRIEYRRTRQRQGKKLTLSVWKKGEIQRDDRYYP